MRAVAVALVLALAAAHPLAAQAVSGVVTDSASGHPIHGALVMLVDSAGAADGALTGGDGRFTLAAPGPGGYRLRIERTGYAPITATVRLADGEVVDVRLAAVPRAITLPPVRVAAERRCVVRPGQGMEAYALWQEARTALRSAAFFQDRHAVEYTVRTWRREIDVRRGRDRRAEDPPRRVTGSPFHTLPPGELETGGYRREQGDSVALYGPDAHVLLSDAFVDAHCLYLGVEDDGGLVGLAFEPVQPRPVAQIRGVLWMDRGTGELRRVDYDYTAPGTVRPSGAGGRVEFSRLSWGAWIVSRWRISDARTASTTAWAESGRRASAVVGVREAGGEVSDAVLRAPGSVPEP